MLYIHVLYWDQINVYNVDIDVFMYKEKERETEKERERKYSNNKMKNFNVINAA